MHEPIVIVGIGEMGAVFAHAFLRIGRPVYPLIRGADPGELSRAVPEPSLVLITVAEDALHRVLAGLPAAWRDRVGLVQNELLPPDWARHDITAPTVAIVWFEKKPGRATRVIIPTPVSGPSAALVVEALRSIDLPAEVIESPDLAPALVAKNLYVLTGNIAGLRTGGTVASLWADHRDFARRVAEEILTIQQWLLGAPVDHPRAIAAMQAGFAGDPDHATTGRSAPSRLARALAHADEAGIAVPTLREIGREIGLSV
jgi:hypothetical protein